VHTTWETGSNISTQQSSSSFCPCFCPWLSITLGWLFWWSYQDFELRTPSCRYICKGAQSHRHWGMCILLPSMMF